MNLSVFDIFKVGIGPSSSHTMGPMNAARLFVEALSARGLLGRTHEVYAQLYGSLALTGLGHCTDRAVLLGFEGFNPATLDPDAIETTLARIRGSGRLRLGGLHEIAFDEPMNLLFHRDQLLPGHSNGMRFTARDADGATLYGEDMYSVGGGFVMRVGAAQAATDTAAVEVPHVFDSAGTLLTRCRELGLELHELVLANERALRPLAEVEAGLDHLWEVMQACVRRGFEGQGLLPGVLRVRRRAPKLHRVLQSESGSGHVDPLEWVDAWALAVNEENAAGGRVVTAPTNGAAGIVPAVLHYYQRFCPGASVAGVRRFLLTA
ncbi:MAG: L-serine ammonia-lyase, partial [Steroidobacteraceae bacterium]|nr:L-serine ammonia-lyase [Steroidobacteraceae bacterium]